VREAAKAVTVRARRPRTALDLVVLDAIREFGERSMTEKVAGEQSYT